MFKFPGQLKDFKNGTHCYSVQRQTTRVKVRGNALALKNVQLIPCIVFLYDKRGTHQWAGFYGFNIIFGCEKFGSLSC